MSPELSQRLRERSPEIEEALLARVRSVEQPTQAADPEYARGLRGAVHSALGCALAELEGAGPGAGPLPAELTAQARLAARSGVSLDTVLRRYLAGHSLLCDYLLGEAGEAPAAALRRALRAEVALLDRILGEVTEAYRREIAERSGSLEHRHAEQVRRLLAGEPADAHELGYELEGWHLGLAAAGAGARAALRELAGALDRRLLMVRGGGEEVWAWLGGRRRIGTEAVLECSLAEHGVDLVLAVGAPGRGISGWRLSHLQAKAALPVARHGASWVVDYGEVALLASALGDEVLARSLRERYLEPLEHEHDGAVLCQTLRAYFATGRNGASTAAALGVSRQTVHVRLHAAEERIGRTLEACATEVETALRLSDLGRVDGVHSIGQMSMAAAARDRETPRIAVV